MNIKIGENLKQLRKAKDITQEELADFLGISFQAISKWERGDSFPDITMLPALSNLFEVSVDELIGMDQIRNRENLTKVFNTAKELEVENKYKDAIELMRNALKTYPKDYSLMSELALALSLDNEYTETEQTSIKEAISLCECVLANSTNEKVRSTTRACLCFLYKNNGEQQKALDLARTLPHVWESREMLLIELFNGSEYMDSLKKSINTVLSIICEKIDNSEHHENMESNIKKMFALGPRTNTYMFGNNQDAISKIADFLD